MLLVSALIKLGQKKICVFQVLALKKLGITFYFVEIFYIEIAFFNTFSPIFPTNLATFCSQLTIKCLGSGQKPR